MSTKRFLLSCILFAGFATSCTSTSTPTATPSTPTTQADAWATSPGKLLAKYHAIGVQVYICAPGPDGKLAWIFKEPQAALADDAGNPVAKHYAGPTWESADGSKVVGTKLSQRPSSNPESIPELQLAAKSHDGAGAFARVSFIERLNTKGGIAPPISADAREGDLVRVPYTADYAFYIAAQ